jgi:hypothetical protein
MDGSVCPCMRRPVVVVDWWCSIDASPTLTRRVVFASTKPISPRRLILGLLGWLVTWYLRRRFPMPGRAYPASEMPAPALGTAIRPLLPASVGVGMGASPLLLPLALGFPRHDDTNHHCVLHCICICIRIAMDQR